MSVGERIRTIRLMEKINGNPAYAHRCGIAVSYTFRKPARHAASDAAGNKQ